jgi:hypothetical protein
MSGQSLIKTPLLSTLSILKVALVISLMLLCHWKMRDTNILKMTGKLPWWLIGTVWAFMLILLILSQETGKSFIYFQF